MGAGETRANVEIVIARTKINHIIDARRACYVCGRGAVIAENMTCVLRDVRSQKVLNHLLPALSIGRAYWRHVILHFVERPKSRVTQARKEIKVSIDRPRCPELWAGILESWLERPAR